jgi:DinB family protein
MDIDWSSALAEQLDWHWQNHLRPRLDGLTDEEYFWEPVPGCWSLRKRGTPTDTTTVGTGEFLFEFVYPEPGNPPVTTIAWRLAHVIVGCLAARNASHFGGPPAEWEGFSYAATAAQALGQLDDVYATWNRAVRALGQDGLTQPCGPAEGPYADCPLAQLVLHINREVLHHGAEIALLRDLYRAKGSDRAL